MFYYNAGQGLYTGIYQGQFRLPRWTPRTQVILASERSVEQGDDLQINKRSADTPQSFPMFSFPFLNIWLQNI